MVGLLDIAPAFEDVPLESGDKLRVWGISADGVAYLLASFPEIQKVMVGTGASITPADIVKLAPKAIAAIIACGCGEVGNDQANAAAAALSIGDQLTLLQSILKLTMPRGIGPFVEQLEAITGSLGSDFLTKAPGTNSRSQSKR